MNWYVEKRQEDIVKSRWRWLFQNINYVDNNKGLNIMTFENMVPSNHPFYTVNLGELGFGNTQEI